MPNKINCNHDKKGNTYKCVDVSHADQVNFHQAFYSEPNKQLQDSLILKYTDTVKPSRNRSTNEERGDKSKTIRYYIPKKDSKDRLQVCRQTFLSTLLLSKNRVQGVVNRHFVTGNAPKESRGGDRKQQIYASRKKAVIEFIKKFRVIDSHYCRDKVTSRVYLSSDLNIHKMWKMYNEENNNLPVKEWYFRNIFCTKFNIGFGTPATDECSTCLSLTERIKHSDNDLRKQELNTKKEVHLMKAKQFYKKLQDKRNEVLVISLDCQKNQVLPRVSDQSAYYSRQIYLYNLTIVIGHSKSPQNKENVFNYYWCETEHSRGSNEVASALHNLLCTKLNIPPTVEILRIASEGCGAQNKNTIMMGMLAVWFLRNAPNNIKLIEFVFPIVGHSFLPSDRVFARIEKVIKKKTVITDPKEYADIISEFGTTIHLADVYDWKSVVQEVFKTPGLWHFHFNKCKRILFRKCKKQQNVLIKGEVNYNSDFCNYKSVCKKSKTVFTLIVLN